MGRINHLYLFLSILFVASFDSYASRERPPPPASPPPSLTPPPANIGVSPGEEVQRPGRFRRFLNRVTPKNRRHKAEEQRAKALSAPWTAYPQAVPGAQRSPRDIAQSYQEGQKRVLSEQGATRQQRAEQRAGFEAPDQPGFQVYSSFQRSTLPKPPPPPTREARPLAQDQFQAQSELQPQDDPLDAPENPSGEGQSFTQNYVKLFEALTWKINSLESQLNRRTESLRNLPDPLKVDPLFLDRTQETDLIHWAYPRLIETMLQLSGESYVESKITPSGEVVEKQKISDNIKDSYFLQRKIQEVENAIKALERQKKYIDDYRNQMIYLLVNHIRVSHTFEPILGINRGPKSSTVEFGLSTPSLQGEQISHPSSETDPRSTSPTGIGQVNVSDTGPLVVKSLIENAIKIFPFKKYFGETVRINNITDIMNYLGKLQGLMSDEIVSLKRDREDLDDPNMRIAFGITGKLALEGFEPQAILYRNTNKRGKEFSGAIFYRDSKNLESCKDILFSDIHKDPEALKEEQRTVEGVQDPPPSASPSLHTGALGSAHRQKTIKDVMVVAYSGSKSSADWEKNYKFISKEVSGQNYLLWGYKVHEGIGAAFEEGYRDLGAQVGELLLKYKRRAIQYLNKCPSNKVELYIITTGHSLGGGLSTLSAIAMKKMVELLGNIEGLNVYVSNISFAAPPVFRRDSSVGRQQDGATVRYDWAARAEKFIGKGNIIRVFVDRDPVATLSFFRKKSSLKKGEDHRGLIATLLKYKHIGIPLMLYDISTWGDDLRLVKNPFSTYWAPHLMPRYGMLVSIFANDGRFVWVRDYLKSSNSMAHLDSIKFQIQTYGSAKKTLEEAMNNLNNLIRYDSQEEQIPETVRANMDNLQDTLNTVYREHAPLVAEYDQYVKSQTDGVTSATVKSIADLETEESAPDVDIKLLRTKGVKTLTFEPYVPVSAEDQSNVFIPSDKTISLNARMTCRPDPFWRDHIDGKFSLRPELRWDTESIKNKMSCSCCLMKNLLLAQGRFGTKLRQTFRGETKVDTYESVKEHCIRRTQCTDGEINTLIDPTNPNEYNAISQWLEKVGGNALNVWRNKSIKEGKSRKSQSYR